METGEETEEEAGGTGEETGRGEEMGAGKGKKYKVTLEH